MAEKSETTFLLSIAGGESIAGAARRSNLSLATAYRRMRDPRITATLAALRQDLLSGLRDRLIAGGASALDKLLTLVNSSDERVALGACKLILDHLLPQRREITVQTDVPPHDVLSDERLREIFDQLAVEGLLTTPEQRTTY